MPIRKKGDKYHWGSKGPFSSRKKAEEVARAAYASGYENSLTKLIKEGDGEGAFNGLSGTVFTSSHAGIFTPTFSGSKVRRIHNKNRRRQERKRHKLMGKDKKNGVDRLVQFLHDGSPAMHKAEPDKDMTGQMQSHSAAGNRVHNLKQIDWDKRQEGISKVEDHPTMGMSNGRDKKIHEAGTAATYPTPDDPSSMHQKTARAPDWNGNNYRLHKQDEMSLNIQNASTEVTGIGPPTNANTMAATGSHPQAAFTEESSDEEKRQQVITQNDFENRVKQYDNKEDDPGVDQPRAAGATAAMSNYPDSNMQMMEKAWGSGPDSYAQDDLHRGGNQDISEDEEDIDDKERDSDDAADWIPEDETEVKSEKVWLDNFQALHKSFTVRGHENPVLAALLAANLDNIHAL